jgi:transcriptional regulator with XRE-family HTH domain
MSVPAPDDPRATFGDNLRSAREHAGLTQEALGHRADFHPTEVNRIERGRRNPGLLTIVKLATALGIPAGDLLDGLPRT